MQRPVKRKTAASWSNVKTRLAGFDRPELIGIIQNLYKANSANRRVLHARFVPDAAALETYRKLVEDAVAPDPLSQRPIRLRDASTVITEYKRSTADLPGVVDLLLTFVESGTEQAADLGVGDAPTSRPSSERRMRRLPRLTRYRMPRGPLQSTGSFN